MKIKKRLISVILVFSYAVGTLFSPIYADPDQSKSFIDELLEERENVNSDSDKNSNTQVKVKADISDFTDVKETDWFYPYLEYLVNEGTINGKT